MTEPQRDLVGYGGKPPRVRWPGDARVAVNLCLNYEEGAETCVLSGDAGHETLLSDMGAMESVPGARHLNIESAYEYGSRAGFWRILDVLGERDIAFTINAVGNALETNPAAARAIADANADILAHGWRWIDYATVEAAVERNHIKRCVETVERLIGKRPLGWYAGRPSLNTRRLVIEHGGFLYDSDSLNDDLPFWTRDFGAPHLIVPYALDTNDSAFTRPHGFTLAEDCFTYWKDCFDRLYREGAAQPKMMTIGLHARIIGRPGRIAALERFLDHVQGHDLVWICQREAIAQHWAAHHPATP